MPIHRHIKNVVHNYTDAERKVREATSNDPWGPSSTLMAEIADKTHNVMAFTEIMQMIWRRLNDSKNWRHVYKALVLLEYITKTGSDKVATQCRENIHSIETLRDFEFFEDGKDHGHNVRAKARLLSALLRDEERLHEERTKALLARDRLMHGGLGTTLSSGGSPSRYPSQSRPSLGHNYPESYYLEKRSPTHSKSPISRSTNELDSVRPQSVGEEQLQLQLAIAISKEEHDREERRRRAEAAKEEAKVQMVLEQSRREGQETFDNPPLINPVTTSNASGSSSTAGGGLFSLVDTSLSAAPAHIPDPWSTPAPSTSITPLAASGTSATVLPIDDPWSTGGPSDFPPVQNVVPAPKQSSSAWPTEPADVSASAAVSAASSTNSPFDLLADVSNGGGGINVVANSNGFHTSSTNGLPSDDQSTKDSENRRRTPADFLGEHQRLVDLDKLIDTNPASTNPFAIGARSTTPVNPFLVNQPAKPSLNQLAPPLALMSSQPTVQQQQQQLANSAFIGGVRPAFVPLANAAYFPAQSAPWPMAVPTSNVALPQNPNGLNPFY